MPFVTRLRRPLGWLLTLLAAALIVAILVAPNRYGRLGVAAFLRVPIEGIVAAALLVVLPRRPRRIAAVLLGAAVGVLALIKVADMGFYESFARSFDPVLDWGLLDDGFNFLTDAVGRGGAIGVAIGAALLGVGVVALCSLAMLRLAAVLVRHDRVARRGIAASAVAWAVLAVAGVVVLPGRPVASDSSANLAFGRLLGVKAGLDDRQAFADATAVDAFRDTRDEDMLTALRGKDVVFAFIESYGRDAVEDPELAPQVGAVLDDGTRRLAAAGYAARAGWLTSSTFGGRSWFAHATFHSGLKVSNQQRYRTLVSSDRQTLPSMFRRAGWETVGVEPNNTYAWPEGDFYGYDRVHDARNIGYRGPKFSWSAMPDQFTLAAFERLERGRAGRGPLMAEVSLSSSHTPWAPIPDLIDWAAVGDGSVYGPMAAAGDTATEIWKDKTRVRAEYRRSIEYSLSSLVSYVEHFGDDDLVLVILGDHQPATVVTGQNAPHDVPITLISRDRAVTDRIASWGWDDGLKPGRRAPVWPMEDFRDRFLTAYGSKPADGNLAAPR